MSPVPRSARGARSGTSTPARGVRRRDAEVLAAATKVFHEKTYPEASVQDVADELGILKGSLYHYIKTKEDLLVWLCEDVHDDLDAFLAEVQAQEDELAPLELLDAYVRSHVLFSTANLARVAVYHHDYDQLSAERCKELQPRRRRHDQYVAGVIAQAQERGQIARDEEPRVLSQIVFSVLTGVYRWYRPGGRLKPAALADLCVDFVRCGLVAGQGGGTDGDA
ncbi:TetR/AcrR family transcriptional regulator [Patulibacter sp. SYSU D01012]|uniref:TetR/AcrR family transcriptional regulator n=1 Tax=Patulibacter sp. SYSU D01012 TaxID=2817381 RepID=UPI001B303798|nr:TetR/AcrR family transcriptional regulator [Patulibacter sp. SYSU D01012]